MLNKLFVAVDEKTLLDAFSGSGEVAEVKILYDMHSGRSRGFGFVNFIKGDDDVSAKDVMDGKEGETIRITVKHKPVNGAGILKIRFALPPPPNGPAAAKLILFSKVPRKMKDKSETLCLILLNLRVKVHFKTLNLQ